MGSHTFWECPFLQPIVTRCFWQRYLPRLLPPPPENGSSLITIWSTQAATIIPNRELTPHRSTDTISNYQTLKPYSDCKYRDCNECLLKCNVSWNNVSILKSGSSLQHIALNCSPHCDTLHANCCEITFALYFSLQIFHINTCFFSTRFSITKRSDHSQARYWLIVDEIRKTFFDMDYHEQSGSGTSTSTGSFTINMQLTAGQIVRVENDRSAYIYGTDSSGIMQSWFTGYMLYSL